ncbi:co-chaperone GroES [Chlamydia abortus]|nr:co-chaperone GroES [Chlamydia abortus]
MPKTWGSAIVFEKRQSLLEYETQGAYNMSDQATTLRIKPLGDRILVKREEEDSTPRGGIILPDTAKKKQDRAEVLALGTGKRDKDGQVLPFEVKVGDTVLIDKYAGQELTIDGEEYVIVQESEVMAVLK